MIRVTFLKRAVVSILYFVTAVTACFFALLLVLNFVNPALSQDSQVIQTKEQPSFKQVFKDIVENLKTVLTGSMEKNSDSSDTPSSVPPQSIPPVSQPEGQVPPDSQPEAVSPEGQVPPDSQPEGISPEGQVPPVSQPEAVSPEGQVPPVSQPEGISPEGQVSPGFQPEAVSPEGQVSPGPQPEAVSPESQVPPGPQPEGASPEGQVSPGSQPEAVSTEAQPMGAPQSFADDLSGIPSEWMLDIQSSIAPFIYEYGKQKDPFDDPTIQEQSAEAGVIVIPKTPPEEHDLTEIKLKGIIWDTQTPKALFELPGQAGYYTLIKGDKIGKNGVIFEIREDEVVVVETTYIGRGENKKEEIKIKIKKMDRLSLSGSSKK
ncbi:MAG: pilus assembly protein PilP [Oligoflexia bacterium]|nr:pilus assembly protein PilP [Oligoflexia bacterium]